MGVERKCPYCAIDRAAAVIVPCTHRAKGVVVAAGDGFMAAIDPNDGCGRWPKMVGPFADEAAAQREADELADVFTKAVWAATWMARRNAAKRTDHGR